MWGLCADGRQPRRKTLVTNLFTLLDFLTTGIYYPNFFFFFKQRRHGLHLLLRKLCFIGGIEDALRRVRAKEWEKKGVPLPEKISIKPHQFSLNPDTARIRGGG